MHPLFWSLSIFCWQDIAEIALIFSLFLYLSVWFKKDTRKPLLMWLYGYTALFIATDYLHMTTLSTLLVTLTPIAGVVAMLLHKDTLQKNFIALHALTEKSEPDTAWPEALIQATLIAAGKNIDSICVLEKQDATSTCIETGMHLNAQVSKDLVTLLLTHPLSLSQSLTVITQAGKVTSINSHWKKNSLEHWFTTEAQEQEQWIQDALFFTTKLDSIVFKLDSLSRKYTVIQAGKITTNISGQSLLRTLCQHTNTPLNNIINEGVFYGTTTPHTPQPTHASSEHTLS